MMKNNPEIQSDCIPQETYISGVELARAYVPIQKLCDTFTPFVALTRGTAFPALAGLYRWNPRQMEVYDDD